MTPEQERALAHLASNFEEDSFRQSQAAIDVLAERRRQVESEGWSSEHDDDHHDGSMALAAACYACNAATWAARGFSVRHENYVAASSPGARWPWGASWWKPKSQRQDLVRAGALILAEIERIDRAASSPVPKGET